MRKLFGPALCAVALIAISAPANAATNLGTVALTDQNPGADFFSFFSYFNENLTAGDYTIQYTFGFPTTGVGAGDVSASLVTGNNTVFNSLDLNGKAFDLNGTNTLGSVSGAPILGSPTANVLTANFKVLQTGIGAFNGSVSATALPEPGTWAMMLLGLGGISWGLRRMRRGETTAQIKFA